MGCIAEAMGLTKTRILSCKYSQKQQVLRIRSDLEYLLVQSTELGWVSPEKKKSKVPFCLGQIVENKATCTYSESYKVGSL